MEKEDFAVFESWFLQLNRKLDSQFEKVDQRSENRYIALLQVCTNTKKDQESMRKDMEVIRKEIPDLRQGLIVSGNQYDARITTLELALSALRSKISQ